MKNTQQLLQALLAFLAESEITIETGSVRVNGKSAIGVVAVIAVVAVLALAGTTF